MVAIIDYGAGNIRSVENAVRLLGREVILTKDPDVIRTADHVILPGVGAFRDAADLLSKTGLDKVIKNEAASGKPILGICLGMQLLLEISYEYGEWNGLGLIPGAIRPIKERIGEDLLIPQIGWNALKLYHDHPLFADTNEGDYVYFVHSYYADASPEHVIATTEYGAELTAAVAKDNVIGCQFHPEKSGPVGLKILRRFCAL